MTIKPLPAGWFEKYRDQRMTHRLYRCYDASGRLLYIGVTCEPDRRLNNHRATRARVASLLLQQFMDHSEVDSDAYRGRLRGEAAERAAIRSEQPLFNLQHTGVPKWLRDSQIATYIFEQTGRWPEARYDIDGFESGYKLDAASIREFFARAAA